MFGGQGLLIFVLILAGLALVIYAFTKVIESPGLSTGGKWAWSLGMGVGYGLLWFPGVILAIVFLSMKERWQLPDPTL